MKIAVFSDTHGSLTALARVREHLLGIDCFAHCGDGLTELDELSRTFHSGYVFVRGNCDPYSEIPLERTVTWNGVRVLLLHGHTVSGKMNLYYRAKSQDCSLVLYGHSHTASCEQHDGIWFVNPGSLSRPRGMKPGSCALISLDGGITQVEILYTNGTKDLYK